MADIFISYASARRPDTIKLADSLTADCFSVWWDKELYLGSEIHSVVGAELANSRAVIVVWTPEAVRSNWVIAEATRAQHEGKLIAVRTPDLHHRDIPTPFNILSTGLVTNHEAILTALASKGLTRRGTESQAIPAVSVPSPSKLTAAPWISRRRLGYVAATAAAFAATGLYLAAPLSRRRGKDEPLLVWPGANDYTASVSYGFNSKLLFTGSWDRRLRLWDPTLDPPALHADWKAHDGVVWWTGCLPGGRAILSAGEDAKLRLWDVGSRKLVREFAEHHGPIWSVAFVAEGQQFVSVSLDGTLKTWSAASAVSTRTVEIGGQLQAVVASRLGDLVIVGGKDGMRTWREGGGERALSVQKHDGDVLALAMFSDGRRVLSAGEDKQIRGWNAETGDNLPNIPQFGQHDGKITSLAISQDDLIVVSASVDRTAKVWDLRSGKLLTTMDHPDAVEAIALAPDGSTAVTACRDKMLRRWNLPVVQRD